ncbi:hypothetical protein BGZ68_000746 [Mortierella alpina]|nr:hypothetical protein BGZ68_000746 [Mortierella alpina]
MLQEEPNQHWTVVERTRRYDRLLYLLIHSSHLLEPEERDMELWVQKLPRYGPEVIPLPSPATVDYLSYYTDMHHDPMMHGSFMTLFPSIPNCYQANVIWYRSMVEIRNRIELAMLDRVGQQLTSLTVMMPLQVPRIRLSLMSNLRRLEVLGSEFCLWTDQDLEAGRHTIERRSAKSRRIGITRLDRMLMFIWDHQRTYGTLRELKIEDKPLSLEMRVGGQLIELVEAMGDRLEVLDAQFWPDAVLFLDRIPTRNLKRLWLHTQKDPAAVFPESGNLATFLSYCRALEDIRMYTKCRDMLSAWRSEEQIHRQEEVWARASQEGVFSQICDSSRRQYGMAKLKRIDIAGPTQDVISVMNEATELFDCTLETMTVRSWFDGKTAPTPLSWSGLILARLSELDLDGEVAWTFNYVCLLNCPRLSRIRLAFSGPKPSRSSLKQPAIDVLSRVPTLQEVELEGHWETLVNRGWPKVLATVQQLERLDLLNCERISAEQVVRLVEDIIETSYSALHASHVHYHHRDQYQRVHCLQTECSSAQPRRDELVSGHCRLRWVLVNKRLEDGIMRQWDMFARNTGAGSPAFGASRGSTISTSYTQASIRRIQFCFVATARPSR